MHRGIVSKRAKLLVLCLVVTIAGCQSVIDETPTPSPGPLERGAINDAPDRLHHDGSFHYSGSIRFISPTAARDDVFNGVMLCLYDEDGDVRNSTVVGTLRGRFDNANYSISSTESPAYVTFDHPRFHEYDAMDQLTLALADHGRYREYHTSLGRVQDDFD